MKLYLLKHIPQFFLVKAYFLVVVFALALLNAGLDGIEHKILPPEPVEVNLFKISKVERKKMGVEELPESLGEALSHMRHSTFTRDMLGEVAYKAYSDSKMKENQLYNTQVSDWELNRYSTVL